MPSRDGNGSTPQDTPHSRWPEATPRDQTAEVFRALGNPVRLRILWLLAHREQFGVEDDPCCDEDVVCVCRIKALFDISAPNLSHHLKVLREAGLVDARRIGIWTHYHLRPQSLDTALEVLNSIHRSPHMPPEQPALAGERPAVERTEGGR